MNERVKEIFALYEQIENWGEFTQVIPLYNRLIILSEFPEIKFALPARQACEIIREVEYYNDPHLMTALKSRLQELWDAAEEK